MGSLSVMKKLSIEELETLIDISEKKIKTYTEMIDEARKELKRRKTKYRCLFIFSDKMAKYYLMDEKRKQWVFIDPEYEVDNVANADELRGLVPEPPDTVTKTLSLKEAIDGIFIYD